MISFIENFTVGLSHISNYMLEKNDFLLNFVIFRHVIFVSVGLNINNF